MKLSAENEFADITADITFKLSETLRLDQELVETIMDAIEPTLEALWDAAVELGEKLPRSTA